MKNQSSQHTTALSSIRADLKKFFSPTNFSVQLKNINRGRDYIAAIEWVNGPTVSEIQEKLEAYEMNFSTYNLDFIRYTRKFTLHFLLSVLLQFCTAHNIENYKEFVEIAGDENDSQYVFLGFGSRQHTLYTQLNDVLNNLNGKYIKNIYAERETAQEKAERIRKEEEEKAAKAKKAQEDWVKAQREKEETELKRKQKEAQEKADKARKEKEEQAKQNNQGWDTNGNGKSRYQKEDFKSYYHKYNSNNYSSNNQQQQNKKQEAPKQNTNAAKKMPTFFWNKIDALSFLGLASTATKEEINKQFKKIILECKVIDFENRKESFKEYNGYTFDMDSMVKAKEKALSN